MKLTKAIQGLLVFLFLAQASLAQETHVTKPTLPGGQPFNAPIPLDKAVENWASGGLGCCVVASNSASANYLGHPEWYQTLKQLSMREPGGHHPEKLQRLLERAKQQHPEMRWEQWWGLPQEEACRNARKWSKLGFPVSITWGYGDNYGRPINHMVTCVHFGEDNGHIAVLDNNFTKEYSVVPTPEGKRRWFAMGGGWASVMIPPDNEWPRKAVAISVGVTGACCLVMLASSFWTAFRIKESK